MRSNESNQKYWITRIWLFLLSVFFALSGYWEVTQHPITYAKTLNMGYPPYFIHTLGVAKVCGAIVLQLPGLYRVKEWVFAGFTFDVMFAWISGWNTGYDADVVKASFAFVVVLMGYFLHRKRLEVR